MKRKNDEHSKYFLQYYYEIFIPNESNKMQYRDKQSAFEYCIFERTVRCVQNLVFQL